MRKVDGGKIRIAVKKILVFLLSLPGVIYIFHIFSQSMITTTSGAHRCDEILQGYGNDYMAEYGNIYFPHFIIDFQKRRDSLCDTWHDEFAFERYYSKYPGMRDEYLGDLVEAILDPETQYFNRVGLLYSISNIVVNDFDESIGLYVEYDDLTPFTQEGIRNVAAWWTNHLQHKADETKSSITRKREYAIANLRENRIEYKKPEPTRAKKETEK